MAEKSPQKSSTKKPKRSIKEKRAAKKLKGGASTPLQTQSR
jgi:hypothetical protein